MRNIDSLKDLFRESFGPPARFHAFAPGRINLIGEHVDYLGGLVVPAAIDRGISVLYTPDKTGVLEVYAADIDSEASWQAGQPIDGRQGWERYVGGCLAELAQPNFPMPAGRMLIAGDLPAGAGLSSSAALIVALLRVILTAQGRTITGVELAKLARRVENVHVGTNCGIMDQFASVHGKADKFMVLDCRTLNCRYGDAHTPDCRWLLVNSMVTHALGDQYNQIRADLESAQQKINKGPLIGLQLTDLQAAAAALTASEMRRARYAVGEVQRTTAFISALEAGNPKEAGRLLQETHHGLSADLGVSTLELDALVAGAATIRGWYGGRMMGGGFGGCTINLVAAGAMDLFRERLTAIMQQQFGFAPEFYPVHIGNGAFCDDLIPPQPAG